MYLWDLLQLYLPLVFFMKMFNLKETWKDLYSEQSDTHDFTSTIVIWPYLQHFFFLPLQTLNDS